MDVYRRFLNSVNLIVCLLLLVLGTTFLAVIIINVFLRYALGMSLPFGDELSRYLLIWFGFLGLMLGVHEGSHAGFDFVKTRVSRRAQEAFSILGLLVIMTYMVLILQGSLQLLPVRFSQTASTMPISTAWPFMAIPISFGLSILRLGYSLICLLTRRDEGLATVASLVGFGED